MKSIKSFKTLLKTDLLVLGCLIGVAFFSCSDQRPDRTGMQEEKRQREIKILKPNQIIQMADSIGISLTKALDLAQLDRLAKDSLLLTCHLDDWRTLLRTEDLVMIKNLQRVPLREESFEAIRKDFGTLSQQIIDAYIYQIEQGEELAPNIQKDKQSNTYLISRSISRNETCFRCHDKQAPLDAIWLMELDEKQMLIR